MTKLRGFGEAFDLQNLENKSCELSPKGNFKRHNDIVVYKTVVGLLKNLRNCFKFQIY